MKTAEAKMDALSAQMASMLKMMEGLTSWRPEAESMSIALSKDLQSLTSRVQALESPSSSDSPTALKREGEGRVVVDHCAARIPQGSDARTQVLHQPLANGQFNPNLPTEIPYYQHHHHKEFRLPKAEFPKFDGSNPRIWKGDAQKYFAMFNVPMHRWTPFATLHFKGIAKLWLQTYEA